MYHKSERAVCEQRFLPLPASGGRNDGEITTLPRLRVFFLIKPCTVGHESLFLVNNFAKLSCFFIFALVLIFMVNDIFMLKVFQQPN